MKKFVWAGALAVLIAAAVPAADRHPAEEMAAVDLERIPRTDLLLRELSDVLGDQGEAELGGLRLQEVLADASVRLQEIAHVEKTKARSWALPGLGHFANGEPATGSLYAAAGVSVAAGALLGAYFLLPGNLQFGDLDYLNDSFQTIQDRWKSHSLVDYMPSLGALAGGFAFWAVAANFASRSAVDLAIERIKSGGITFQPYGAAEALGLQATWRR